MAPGTSPPVAAAAPAPQPGEAAAVPPVPPLVGLGGQAAAAPQAAPAASTAGAVTQQLAGMSLTVPGGAPLSQSSALSFSVSPVAMVPLDVMVQTQAVMVQHQSQLVMRIAELEREKSALQSENQALVEQVQELEEDKAELQERLVDEYQKYSEKVASIEQELVRVTAENTALKQRMTALSEQIEETTRLHSKEMVQLRDTHKSDVDALNRKMDMVIAEREKEKNILVLRQFASVFEKRILMKIGGRWATFDADNKMSFYNAHEAYLEFKTPGSYDYLTVNPMNATEAKAYEGALEPLVSLFAGAQDVEDLSELMHKNIKWAKGRGNALSHDEDMDAPEVRGVVERMCAEDPRMQRENWVSFLNAMNTVWQSSFSDDKYLQQPQRKGRRR